MKFRILVGGWLLLVAAATTGAAEPVHGSGDAFASPGVALAWAILRGAREADTLVVIRIVADARAYRALDVTGVDPFSKTEQLLQPRAGAGAPLEVRIPRTRFADLPRTEIRLYADDGKDPALTVFYLGVPDTTPEFADAAKLDAYLVDRVARARTESSMEKR